MPRDAVLYKGVYLAKGSECFALHEAKKWKQLDELLTLLDHKKKKLEGIK